MNLSRIGYGTDRVFRIWNAVCVWPCAKLYTSQTRLHSNSHISRARTIRKFDSYCLRYRLWWAWPSLDFTPYLSARDGARPELHVMTLVYWNHTRWNSANVVIAHVHTRNTHTTNTCLHSPPQTSITRRKRVHCRENEHSRAFRANITIYSATLIMKVIVLYRSITQICMRKNHVYSSVGKHNHWRHSCRAKMITKPTYITVYKHAFDRFLWMAITSRVIISNCIKHNIILSRVIEYVKQTVSVISQSAWYFI